jgi:molecular chaperone GrpE
VTDPTPTESKTMSENEQQQNPDVAAEQPADETQQKLEQLENQVREKEQKYLYLYAEFENFKKRTLKERSDLIKFGWEPVARDLLQVADNLERALAHTPENTDKNLVQGLNMVLNLFRATMEKQGVQVVQSLGQGFDPNLHEAVGQVPSDKPSGTIVEENQKGYTLHGRLLRPARVVISQGPATELA